MIWYFLFLTPRLNELFSLAELSRAPYLDAFVREPLSNFSFVLCEKFLYCRRDYKLLKARDFFHPSEQNLRFFYPSARFVPRRYRHASSALITFHNAPFLKRHESVTSIDLRQRFRLSGLSPPAVTLRK